MSLSNRAHISRRIMLAGIGSSLAGCGLRPLYGDAGRLDNLVGRVAITANDNPNGYRIRDLLLDRLGPPTAPDLQLNVSVTTNRDSAAISGDGDITRIAVIGVADWVLRDATADLASGRVQGFTGYDTTGSTVATQAVAAATQDELMSLLVDRILADLALKYV